jgi:hypothetical protein
MPGNPDGGGFVNVAETTLTWTRWKPQRIGSCWPTSKYRAGNEDELAGGRVRNRASRAPHLTAMATWPMLAGSVRL